MTDQQLLDVGNLRKSSRQAEEALTKGIEKLQETLTDGIASHPLGSGSYGPQMAMATENLEALECFVNQVIFKHFLMVITYVIILCFSEPLIRSRKSFTFFSKIKEKNTSKDRLQENMTRHE